VYACSSVLILRAVKSRLLYVKQIQLESFIGEFDLNANASLAIWKLMRTWHSGASKVYLNFR
jgi:hypothetical protein